MHQLNDVTPFPYRIRIYYFWRGESFEAKKRYAETATHTWNPRSIHIKLISNTEIWSAVIAGIEIKDIKKETLQWPNNDYGFVCRLWPKYLGSFQPHAFALLQNMHNRRTYYVHSDWTTCCVMIAMVLLFAPHASVFCCFSFGRFLLLENNDI